MPPSTERITMKILSSVTARLANTETATAPDWFTKLSKEKQQEYIKLHPRVR